MLGAGALVAHGGMEHHYALTDERGVMGSARHLQTGFPGSLFSAEGYPRGIERLLPWLMGLVIAVVPGTTRELQTMHVMGAGLFALTAVPVYALARALGLTRWQALFPAALSVTGPFALYGVMLFDNGIGYLATACLLLAMWHSTARPSARNDLLALAAMAFVAGARIGNLPLALALPVAILVQTWRDRPAGTRVARRATGLPRRIWDDHRVLVLAAGAGLAFAAVRGLDLFIGGTGYGGGRLHQTITLDRLWFNARLTGSHVAMASGVLGLVIGLPWIVREAVRPRSRETGAFAVLAVAAFAAFSYAYFLSSDEDRYFLPLLPLVSIAFARALFAREVALVGVAIAAALVGRVIVTSGYWPDGPVNQFIAPSSLFWRNVVVGNLSVHLPFSTHHVATVALLGVAAVAVVLALRGRIGSRWAGLATAAVVIGALGYGVAASEWSIRRWTHDGSSSTVRFDQQAFIDGAVGQDAKVPILDGGQAFDPATAAVYDDLNYWNASLDGVVQTSVPGGAPCCSPDADTILQVDPRSGTVTTRRDPPKPYLLRSTGFADVGVHTEPVAQSSVYPGVKLERLARPLHAAWVLRGSGPGGWGIPGRTQRIHTYAWPGRPPSTCLNLVLTAPPHVANGLPYRLRSGAGQATGTLQQQEARAVSVPLGARDEGVTLTARATGALEDGKTQATVRTSDITVGPCPA